MPEIKDENSKSFDPFEPFRSMRDAYLDAISKSMIEAVNTEGYAQATGAMLDYYLSATAPLREALDQSMAQALQHLCLPSRQDVIGLAERFTNVEMRLDDLDGKIDRLLSSIPPPKQEQSAKPDSGPARQTGKRG